MSNNEEIASVKTVIVFNELCDGEIKFIVFDGDFSHLNNIYINGEDEDKAQELYSLLYDENGMKKVEFLLGFPMEIVRNKECKVIVCGFA